MIKNQAPSEYATCAVQKINISVKLSFPIRITIVSFYRPLRLLSGTCACLVKSVLFAFKHKGSNIGQHMNNQQQQQLYNYYLNTPLLKLI